MRKLLLSALAIGMMACTSDDTTDNTPDLDCDCNRVVQVYSFQMQNPNGGILYHGTFFTINDCTRVQMQRSYSVHTTNQIPVVGQCR
jgi:hypothetical protein